METLYSPQSRSERFIAVGRVVLAASSLFAVWLDPSEPAKYAPVAYSLLVAYVVYSSVIALLVWRSDDPGGRERLVTHGVDLAFFSLFIYFTAGPASPFTSYFVFSMICATLRWQWRGVLWTAAASIAAYLGVALYFAEALASPGVEIYQLIIRVVYLAVIAMLLGALGAHEERTRREISQLARWPEAMPHRLQPAVESLLEHAARVLGAPRVLLAWVESEEPWLYLASWQGGELAFRREPPEAFDPLVAPALAEGSFLCPEPGDPPSPSSPPSPPIVLLRTAAGLRRWRGLPLHPGLAAELGAAPLLGVRLRSESFEGHLLFLGKRAMTSDDLLLGEAVAGMVAARLDSVYLTRSLEERAATEARIRLARDLHDGVLQSLTGIGLRLETVRRLMEESGAGAIPANGVSEAAGATGSDDATGADDAGGAMARLEELQSLIALEQRDLRFFIQELKPQPAASPGEPGGLRRQVAELVRRLEIEWGLRVDLRMDGLEEEIPAGLTREIYHIVREALVNAVRHGAASLVRVEIRAGEERVSIAVSDNGRGFPFAGRFSHAELMHKNLGPRNLRERVAALSGTVALDSSRAGARLEVLLPIGPLGAGA
jgi:signal transduction histidine kinase